MLGVSAADVGLVAVVCVILYVAVLVFANAFRKR